MWSHAAWNKSRSINILRGSWPLCSLPCLLFSIIRGSQPIYLLSSVGVIVGVVLVMVSSLSLSLTPHNVHMSWRVECGSVIVEDVLVMVSHSLSLSDELTAGSLHQWVDGGHPAVTSSHTDHKIDGRRIVFGQSNFLLHPTVLPCIETYKEN